MNRYLSDTKYKKIILLAKILLVLTLFFVMPTTFFMMPTTVVYADNDETDETLQPQATTSSDTVSYINKFNGYISKALAVAGGIVIALGIMTLIMAFSEQSLQSKTRGSLMVAGGIVLIVIQNVYNSFGIKKGASATKILNNMLDTIGTAMTYVGAILSAFAIIQILMAYINMNSEEKTNGLKALATAIAFICGSSIMKGVKKIYSFRKKSNLAKYTVGYVTRYIIGRPATYIGVGLLVYGLIQLIMGFKNEDAESKHQGSMVIIAGIALVSFVQIFGTITGIKNDTIAHSIR